MRGCVRLALALTLVSAGVAAADPLPGADSRDPALQAQLDAAQVALGNADPRSRHRRPDGSPRFVNRLVLEQSPYLRQHANNPVDWYPWGDEAFARARALGRPVLLSIGYSTCHWCHVMEEESFDDLEIAEYLNRNYVAIKVDREERPDIDGVYIVAVQILTRAGAGWPLTVWLNPDRQPFHGATYLPPRARPQPGRPGRPGFLETLQRAAEIYRSQPDDVAATSAAMERALAEALATAPSVGAPTHLQLAAALEGYRGSYDAVNGGLLGRTKFPSSLPISFLLRAHRRTGDARLLEMATETLDAMRRGGLHDHVGGGFHRYTTEPTWTVPHFEKMLYDNALLVVAYTEAWQATGDPAYAEVVRDVLDYVARDMTSELGTFYSASDADSEGEDGEGEEGAYFVWTRGQVAGAVGEPNAPLALAAYGVTARGNFEGGRNVLRRDRDAAALAAELNLPAGEVERRLPAIRESLREVRSRRIPPHTDHKQLVGWNGLMISALARAGLSLGEAAWIGRAERAADVLLERARRHGRLARYLSDGRPFGTGVLDDYAFLEAGLLDLFEATGETRWLEGALALQGELDAGFATGTGGYWLTRHDAERLLAREKPGSDGARPSGNSVAALNLLRLYLWTSDESYRAAAEMTVRSFSSDLDERPTQLGRLLDAVDFMLDTPKEILIVTPGARAEAEPFLRELGRVFLPNRVVVVVPEPEIEGLAGRVPLLEHKRALDGRTTAYVCENRVCELPARDPKLFREQLDRRTPKRAGKEPG